MGELHLVFLTNHECNDLLVVLGRRCAPGLELLDSVLAEFQLDLAPGSQSVQVTPPKIGGQTLQSFSGFRALLLSMKRPSRIETMKFMLTWSERPQGSPMEYENAQKRILEVFTQWKAPANFKIELFVIRVGDWGGYMMLDCDDPTAVHKFCSMLPAFVFEARPVIPIEDAVRVELESIAFRDGLKAKK